VSCLETEWTFIRNAKLEKRAFRHWIHAVGELKQLVKQPGFTATHLDSWLDQAPFKRGDQRLVAVAQRARA